MSADITRELLAEVKRLDERATKGPWFTVEYPWLPRDQATYVIAGHHDPHIGIPICDALEPDCFEGEDDADLERQEQDARAQSDTNMEFIALSRTALPALAREYEIERALSLTRQKALAEATERYTAAEQQRDEMAKALEAVDGDLSLLLIAIESGDARGELLTRALFAKRDVERALTPKEPT